MVLATELRNLRVCRLSCAPPDEVDEDEEFDIRAEDCCLGYREDDG